MNMVLKMNKIINKWIPKYYINKWIPKYYINVIIFKLNILYINNWIKQLNISKQ